VFFTCRHLTAHNHRCNLVKTLHHYRNLLGNTSRSTCMASTGRTEGEVMLYFACRVGKRAMKAWPLSKGDGTLHTEVLLYWQSLWLLSGR
jgi:hypothetical protein